MLHSVMAVSPVNRRIDAIACVGMSLTLAGAPILEVVWWQFDPRIPLTQAWSSARSEPGWRYVIGDSFDEPDPWGRDWGGTTYTSEAGTYSFGPDGEDDQGSGDDIELLVDDLSSPLMLLYAKARGISVALSVTVFLLWLPIRFVPILRWRAEAALASCLAAVASIPFLLSSPWRFFEGLGRQHSAARYLASWWIGLLLVVLWARLWRRSNEEPSGRD